MSATNKAVYTATKVACGWGRGSDEKANPSYWAGVVMQKPLLNAKKKTDGDGRKDRRTDREMDRWMEAGQTDGRTNGQNRQMEKLRNGTTDIAIQWGLILKKSRWCVD